MALPRFLTLGSVVVMVAIVLHLSICSCKADSSLICRTSGGYVAENKACVFPFTYYNPRTKTTSKIESCVESAGVFAPFITRKRGRRPRQAFPPSLTGKWCSTTANYNPKSKAKQRKWGYCVCHSIGVSEDEEDECSRGEKNEPCAFAPTCSGEYTYRQAEDLCKARGARLCSVSELVDFRLGSGVCAGTPNADAWVWTLDSCLEQPPNTSPRFLVSSSSKVSKPFCSGTTKSQKMVGVRCCKYPDVERKRGILMVIADDMRTDTMMAYGRKLSLTPGLDRFASDPRTVVFEKAYANYAQCSPSRLSFLTGLKPDTTGAVELIDWLTMRSPNNLTIPEFFRAQGFTVMNGGKVFHEKALPNYQLVRDLWNETFDPFVNQYTFNKECRSNRAKPLLMSNRKPAAAGLICQTDAGEDALVDFTLERRATYALTKVAMYPDTPFLITVGFYKPHLPWVVHKNYITQTPRTMYNDPVVGPQPEKSYLPIFYDVDAALSALGGNRSPWGATKINPDFIRVARRAYSAAITQMDSRFQVLLDRLDQLKLADTTLVLFFGDHGFNVGENGLWNKDTMFDTALRVPLMIRVPWATIPSPKKQLPIRRATSHFIQLVDLYRTAASLMGLGNRIDPWIEGHDFSAYVLGQIGRSSDVPESSLPVSAAEEAYGQVRRCGYVLPGKPMVNKACLHDETQAILPISWMGYTVRTREWRYMAWLNAPNGVVDWTTIIGEELYDHRGDAKTLFNYATGVSYNIENWNIAAANPNITQALLQKIMVHFRRSQS